MADWLESYSVTQHIVFWTSSCIIGRPSYDPTTRRWYVIVDRNGVQRLLYPAHIVLATGTHGAPRLPELTGRDEFTGSVLHSVEFRNSTPFVGKHVVVIGAGNTGIDICQDLAVGGAASVTMVQRSSSCVVSRSIVRGHLHDQWKPNTPVEIGDFKFAGFPLGLFKQIMIASQDAQWEEEKELHTKLTKGGLALNLGPEGQGQTLLVFERGAGYCESCFGESFRSGLTLQ